MADRFRNLFHSSKPEITDAQFSTSSGFSILFEHAHLSVFRYLYGLTGGPAAEVEDLTAETFSRAWKTRRIFHGDERAATGWLLTIARRLVIDRYRRRKTHPAREENPPAELANQDPGPEEIVSSGEEQSELLRMLQSLPDGPREMLVLRYMLGWHVHQIADHLGIPDNTVSVTIRRTLDRLHRDWPRSQEK